MDELTPDAIGALVKGEARPEDQNAGKDAWVTPVVREYEPVDVTKAFFSGTAATDGPIYS